MLCAFVAFWSLHETGGNKWLHYHLLQFQGLGCCHRKDIVGVAARLQHLDGTPVLKQERLFLQRLHSRKLTRDASFKNTSGDTAVGARHMLVSFWLPCAPPWTPASPWTPALVCALANNLGVVCFGALCVCPVAAEGSSTRHYNFSKYVHSMHALLNGGAFPVSLVVGIIVVSGQHGFVAAVCFFSQAI